LLGSQGTLLAHGQLAVHQDTQVPLQRAALQLVWDLALLFCDVSENSPPSQVSHPTQNGRPDKSCHILQAEETHQEQLKDHALETRMYQGDWYKK